MDVTLRPPVVGSFHGEPRASSLPSSITTMDFESTTPRRMLKASLGWSRGPWEVDGYLGYQSSFSGFTAFDIASLTYPLVSISSYATVDGRVGYRLNERMTLALAGRNLTRSAQRQTSAPNVERQLFATFSMVF